MRLIIKDLRHLRIKYDAYRIGILTLIVVVLWIGLEIYHAYTQTTIASELEGLLEPLDPSIDVATVEGLSERLDAPETFQVVISEDSENIFGRREIPPASPSGSSTATPSGF